MKITADLLVSAMGASPQLAGLFAPHLAEACAAYEINTPLRLAHFLAQVGHETNSLIHAREVWGPTPAQARYERNFAAPWPETPTEARRAEFAVNRLAYSLGNEQVGDGRKFSGHGLIQTTGRGNHRAVRDRLRARGIDAPDFEAAPELLERPRWAALSAADYWGMRNINALADADDHEAVTRAVNGGTNGIDDRRRRLVRAKAAIGAVQEATTPAPTAPPPAAPAREPWQSDDPGQHTQESGMPLPIIAATAGSFLWELAKGAIATFTPLAAEKLTKEMNRHTDKPEIAGQIVSSVIEAVKTATKKIDPLEAVVALKAAPELVPQVEAESLASLDKMLPVLDKMQQWEQSVWAAEEASRTAADERARSAEKDQDEFLTRAIVGLVIGLLVLVLGLIPLLVYLKADSGTIGTLVGLFAAAGASIIQSLNTRIQHRYGSSRGSAAKDVLAAELARRPKQ